MKLDPFHFNKMVTETCELCGIGKRVFSFTIKNFYNEKLAHGRKPLKQFKKEERKET